MLPCPITNARSEMAIAMVSFGVDRLPDSLTYLSPPQSLPQAPYHGCRAAVATGVAGELIELIEH